MYKKSTFLVATLVVMSWLVIPQASAQNDTRTRDPQISPAKPVQTCDCKAWTSIKITRQGLTTTITCPYSGSAIDVPTTATPVSIVPAYTCTPGTGYGCPNFRYKIDMGPTLVLPSSFTFSGPGLHIVTVYAYCGFKKCDSCKIPFIIKEGPTRCVCVGPWVMSLKNGPVVHKLICDSLLSVQAGIATSVAASYTCQPSSATCYPKYGWRKNHMGPYNMGLPSWGSLTAGDYLFTVYVSCDNSGQVPAWCDSCTFRLLVHNPQK